MDPNPGKERLSTEAFRRAHKVPLVIVLDNIRSQNNIGSVFRTADAFRLEAIFLCGITATPPHREIHKTALGATESVRWRYFAETNMALDHLRENGYRIIAIEQTTNSLLLQSFIPGSAEKLALIFGNEVHGISPNILAAASACIEIPQFGTKHSLNVSVSVGIVIWDIFSKMNFSKTDETFLK